MLVSFSGMNQYYSHAAPLTGLVSIDCARSINMPPRWAKDGESACFYTPIALWDWRYDDTKSYENPRNPCNPINPRFRRVLVRLGTRPIGVNLGIFMVFRGSVSIDAAPTGLKDLGQTRFYTDTVPTGLKRFLESSRFPRSIRFG